MVVTLRVDNQFGTDGPQAGAVGITTQIIQTDGDYMALVAFKGFPGELFWVFLRQIMWPDTSGTETVFSTHRQIGFS